MLLKIKKTIKKMCVSGTGVLWLLSSYVLSLLCVSIVSTGFLCFWILVIHMVRGVKTVQHNRNTLNLLLFFCHQAG